MKSSEEEVNDEIERTRFGGDIHPQTLVKPENRLEEATLDGDKFREWGYKPSGDERGGAEERFDSGSDSDTELVDPGSTLRQSFNEHYGAGKA